MSNEKLFELMEMMYNEMLEIKTDVKGLKDGQKNLKDEVLFIKNTVTKIEHDHGKKLNALFDGHKQNADKLDRIEKEVSKQEEVILRRIR